MKVLLAIVVFAQISTKPPSAQVRSGTVNGTVTITADNPFGDPEPILKGTCANLVATAKIGPLTSKAKATGDLTKGTCSFSISGVGEGGATVSLAFEGADFPTGDLGSTPATVRNGETTKVAMAVKWPKVQKQNVAITFDYTGNLGVSCNGKHVKIVGSKTIDVDLTAAPPKCTKLVGLVPGTWTFTLYDFVNAIPEFQPQTMNVQIAPFAAVMFKMPEKSTFRADFYPKAAVPAACNGLVLDVTQGGASKGTVAFKPFVTEKCYADFITPLPVATPVDLKVLSGNVVLASGQKTLVTGNSVVWEVHQQ